MNLLCKLGLHKWIGAHEHRGKIDLASCIAGCICVRCGFRPTVKDWPVPVVTPKGIKTKPKK